MRVKPVVRFQEEYYFLSNFYPARVTIGKAAFATTEAAFQAAKYRAMNASGQQKSDYIMSVANASSPAAAKYLGRSVSIDTDQWDSIKVQCMREILKAKFDQNEAIRLKLMETGACMLVEGNDWNDRYWGRCEGKGLNVLGTLLMELRGHYFWKEMESLW